MVPLSGFTLSTSLVVQLLVVMQAMITQRVPLLLVSFLPALLGRCFVLLLTATLVPVLAAFPFLSVRALLLSTPPLLMDTAPVSAIVLHLCSTTLQRLLQNFVTQLLVKARLSMLLLLLSVEMVPPKVILSLSSSALAMAGQILLVRVLLTLSGLLFAQSLTVTSVLAHAEHPVSPALEGPTRQ
jgi:hypothetical protein